MKKVLLGLLAVSAISIAGPPDLEANPSEGTNIFQTGQEGAIVVKGKVLSDIPVIKYVIYASNDNGTTKEDILTLEDFVLTKEMDKGGFVGVNPKVYIRRVVGEIGTENYGELENEIVEVCLEGDPSYNKTWITSSSGFQPKPSTGLLSRSTLEEIIKNSGITGASITSNGTITKGSNNFAPNNRSLLEIGLSNKSEITIQTRVNANTGAMDQADTDSLLAAFEGGKEITTAKLLVRIR